MAAYDYDFQLGNGFSVAPGIKGATSTAGIADMTGMVGSTNHSVLAYKAEATLRAQYAYEKAYAFVTPGYEMLSLTGANQKDDFGDIEQGIALDMGIGYQASKDLGIEANLGTSWVEDKVAADDSKIDNWRFGVALRYSF